MGLKQCFVLLLAALQSACVFCGPRAPIHAPVTLASGVIVQDILVPEAGPVVELGDHIVLHYEMMLEDGSVLDSSFERGQPVELVVGAGELPSGLEQGLLGMRLFGKRKLIVPAELGYGAEGLLDRVPANALLVFMLELMGLEPSQE